MSALGRTHLLHFLGTIQIFTDVREHDIGGGGGRSMTYGSFRQDLVFNGLIAPPIWMLPMRSGTSESFRVGGDVGNQNAPGKQTQHQARCDAYQAGHVWRRPRPVASGQRGAH
jgi:hypothetical protein